MYHPTRARAFALAAAASVLLGGCRGLASVLIDLPTQSGARGRPALPGPPAAPPRALDERPPIERWLQADSVLLVLPRDGAGNVDWMGALRRGIIRPRGVLPGVSEPVEPGFQPEFDIVFRGPDSTVDARFPHSSHVQWLACRQCHRGEESDGAVRYEKANVLMADLLGGRFCGRCHGVVAFSLSGQVEGCARCHQRLADAPDTGRASDSAPASGAAVYRRWCAMCHGPEGHGDGPVGRTLDPRPRDLTAGVFQIRTTASGEPPVDDDLHRVIDEGIPGSAMPGWKMRLTARQRDSLVAFIKTLSNAFTGPPVERVALGDPPPPSPADSAAGRETYENMQCFKCHGDEGHGDGPSAAGLEDDWGVPIKPADLARAWTFNGGGRVVDIYTRLRTGLDGTPMPSYSDAVSAGVISDAQLWQLARYVGGLSRTRSPLGDLELRLRRIAGDPRIPGSDTLGAGAGVNIDSVPRARFPHWVHRIRYRCKACHPDLFQPEAGANAITMVEINRGEACGRCHNGVVAFRAGFGQCHRCHS